MIFLFSQETANYVIDGGLISFAVMIGAHLVQSDLQFHHDPQISLIGIAVTGLVCLGRQAMAFIKRKKFDGLNFVATLFGGVIVSFSAML